MPWAAACGQARTGAASLNRMHAYAQVVLVEDGPGREPSRGRRVWVREPGRARGTSVCSLAPVCAGVLHGAARGAQIRFRCAPTRPGNRSGARVFTILAVGRASGRRQAGDRRYDSRCMEELRRRAARTSPRLDACGPNCPPAPYCSIEHPPDGRGRAQRGRFILQSSIGLHPRPDEARALRQRASRGEGRPGTARDRAIPRGRRPRGRSGLPGPGPRRDPAPASPHGAGRALRLRRPGARRLEPCLAALSCAEPVSTSARSAPALSARKHRPKVAFGAHGEPRPPLVTPSPPERAEGPFSAGRGAGCLLNARRRVARASTAHRSPTRSCTAPAARGRQGCLWIGSTQ